MNRLFLICCEIAVETPRVMGRKGNTYVRRELVKQLRKELLKVGFDWKEEKAKREKAE